MKSSLGSILVFALVAAISVPAYWGSGRIKELFLSQWKAGGHHQVVVTSLALGVVTFTALFFSLFSVANGALLVFGLIVIVALAAFEIYSSDRESRLVAGAI